MPKKHRLTGAEIRSIRSPRRVHGALFSLSISPAIKEAKFACVVSKKVAARAVARNTIKRRCRAVATSEVRVLPAGTYIAYAKKGAATASYREMADDLKTLFKKVRGA